MVGSARHPGTNKQDSYFIKYEPKKQAQASRSVGQSLKGRWSSHEKKKKGKLV